NIYYENVSKRYKNPLKNYLYTCINMDFHNIDARHFVQNTQQRYDLIFLDGFTPAKCPCLWSENFIKLLCIHLNDNGILTTYNTSAPVRNALLKAGFFIGNTFDSLNKTIGTIAAKNPALIKNKLSDKYYYLLSTKAGITYKDVTLSLDNDTILLNRLSDIENSNLETSSHYLKRKNYEL
ncbi:MAG: hypothetical protein LUB59_02220, partial [Candidatus Gastranaerophilales bacterium]|nr:hypothetical protein [Candidatus Gastranaerophilales bacterium]